MNTDFYVVVKSSLHDMFHQSACSWAIKHYIYCHNIDSQKLNKQHSPRELTLKVLVDHRVEQMEAKGFFQKLKIFQIVLLYPISSGENPGQGLKKKVVPWERFKKVNVSWLPQMLWQHLREPRNIHLGALNDPGMNIALFLGFLVGPGLWWYYLEYSKLVSWKIFGLFFETSPWVFPVAYWIKWYNLEYFSFWKDFLASIWPLVHEPQWLLVNAFYQIFEYRRCDNILYIMFYGSWRSWLVKHVERTALVINIRIYIQYSLAVFNSIYIFLMVKHNEQMFFYWLCVLWHL